MIKKLRELLVADLESVYSGIDGRCCCGCSGTHFERGDTDKSPARVEKMLAKVLRLIQAAGEERAEWISSTCFSWVSGARVYIAYLREHGDRGFRKEAEEGGAPVEVADWTPAPVPAGNP